jgi:hypothetical protein
MEWQKHRDVDGRFWDAIFQAAIFGRDEENQRRNTKRNYLALIGGNGCHSIGLHLPHGLGNLNFLAIFPAPGGCSPT